MNKNKENNQKRKNFSKDDENKQKKKVFGDKNN